MNKQTHTCSFIHKRELWKEIEVKYQSTVVFATSNDLKENIQYDWLFS
jgi:hypothetical protein